MGYDLFSWLAQYHLQNNLIPNLPFIKDSQYLKARGGAKIEEGEENDDTKGVLILSNGDSLVRRLKEEEIILDRSTPMFVPARDYVSFTYYLSRNIRKDGAFVYDGKNESISRISKFGNSSSKMNAARDSYQRYLPANFIYQDAAVMNQEEYDEQIGTKSDLAMVLPISHTKEDSYVHAYQIKRTAYGNTGLGKVTHFGPDGLMEEFFFRYAPESDGPFVVPERKIVGVHRKYKREADDKLYVASENVVGPTLEEYFRLQE